MHVQTRVGAMRGRLRLLLLLLVRRPAGAVAGAAEEAKDEEEEEAEEVAEAMQRRKRLGGTRRCTFQYWPLARRPPVERSRMSDARLLVARGALIITENGQY